MFNLNSGKCSVIPCFSFFARIRREFPRLVRIKWTDVVFSSTFVSYDLINDNSKHLNQETQNQMHLSNLKSQITPIFLNTILNLKIFKLKKMKTFRILLLLCCFFPALTQATANTPESIFDQLYGKEVLDIQINIDIVQLDSMRRTNDKIPAHLTFVDANGETQEWDMKVRTRGRYRRMKCGFPPLKLDFSKKDLKKAGLAEFDKMKLVTQCLDGEKGEELVLRENLAYQLYQELTPQSYRTQLVRVTYICSSSNETITNYGIIIEDKDQLTARLNVTECENCYAPALESFQQDNVQRHALFQYMIGNADWSIPENRNLKLFKSNVDSSMIAVAYDFDFSGIVDAPYAVRSGVNGAVSVKKRIYLGNEALKKEMHETVEYFISKKGAILNTIKGYELLSKRDRKSIQKYVQDFYKDIERSDINFS